MSLVSVQRKVNRNFLVVSTKQIEFCGQERIHNIKSYILATLPSFMNQTGHGIAPSAIPWQVSIRNHWKPHFCSGVMLDHKTVLSSANCFKKLKTLKGIRVMAGDVNYKQGQNIGVRKTEVLEPQ